MNSHSTTASVNQRTDLLRAVASFCTCEHDNSGTVLLSVCAGHEALMDPAFERRMTFARSLAAQLLAEEWLIVLPAGRQS